MKLVVVESPSKAKTIQKYLGTGYEVLASYGHVRDLLPKKGAVDPDNDFAMRYEVIEKNLKHLDAITRAVKKADTLLLATDPDREGEAIAWHVVAYLTAKKALKDKEIKRVAFYEITKQRVNEAISNPREIAQDMVDAQQARRALDYLVGFNLSPLLWKKVRRGLSAGRVQSPALRLIVEREEEIEKFKAEEYWTIEADWLDKKKTFIARLIEYQGKKCQKFDIQEVGSAEAARDHLLAEAKGELVVSKIEKKDRVRQPVAPFTTSTLQQEAIRKLGFTSKRAMMIAQQLYEGIDIGGGAVGLITYMRTDSVNLGAEAMTNLRDLITERYGAENLPKEPRVFSTKSKNAQEAHEAVRPTDAMRTPELMKSHLTPEQFKLYDLIWKRTVACQMIPAVLETVAIDFACGDPKTGGVFRANGSTIKVLGFMSVYQEGGDDDLASDDDEKLLPALKEKQAVPLQGIRSEQHFTDPPPRYTEASLVKALEEFGIGRPSTYATIISTLQSREYVLLDKKRFSPTEVGRIVSHFLTKYFTRYVDYDFTAKMEDDLDAIARGEKAWIPTLHDFWKTFIKQVGEIETTVQRSDVTQEKMDEACPECAKPLSIRLGRSGRFIGCTAYPECKYTRSLEAGPGEGSSTPQVIADRKCPKCEGDLVMKVGRYGQFIGCANYPNCKHIESLNKPKETDSGCPECQQGMMVQRRSRFGKIFYSCHRYPDCKYALWNEPINTPCPKCAWPLLTLKVTKRRGTEKVCPHEGCGFTESVDTEEA